MKSKNLKSKIDWYIITKVKEIRSVQNLEQDDIAGSAQLSVSLFFSRSPNIKVNSVLTAAQPNI